MPRAGSVAIFAIPKTFRYANIETVEELVEYTEERLRKMKNFGRKSLLEVKEALSDMGLYLKPR